MDPIKSPNSLQYSRGGKANKNFSWEIIDSSRKMIFVCKLMMPPAVKANHRAIGPGGPVETLPLAVRFEEFSCLGHLDNLF